LNAFAALSPEEAFDMSMFEQEDKEAKIVRIPFYQKYRRLAAVALLVLAIGGGTYFMNLSDNTQIATVQTEKEEAQKAFEVAKASLLLISQKMNKGAKHVNALEKFDLTHEKINPKVK